MALRCAWVATILAALSFDASLGQTPLGTGFTYQGQLKQNGQPYNGSANLIFKLFDAATGGNLLGTQTLNGVNVSAGALHRAARPQQRIRRQRVRRPKPLAGGHRQWHRC